MFDHHQSSAEEPSISRLAQRLSEHVGTRFTYMRLVLTEKFAQSYVRHVSNDLVIRLFTMFLFFISIAAGLWIGKSYDDYGIGFAIVGSFYFLVFLLYLALRKSVIDKKMVDKVIASLSAKDEEDEEDEEA